MGMLFSEVSRREALRQAGRVTGALAISASFGGSIARAAVDTSKFLTKGKIGFGTILPLSGGFTVVSQPWIHAIKYAIEEVNSAGGIKIGGSSYQVTNLIGDEMYSAAGGLSAFRKMVADNVHYSGGYVSVEAPAAVQGINQRSNHLMVGGITGKDLCMTDNQLRFYEYALAQASAPYLADFAFNVLKVRRVASIELANTWGADFHMSFKNTFEELGGKIVNRSLLQPTQTDFSAIVSQMAADKAELLYLVMGDGPATTVGIQARAGGLGGIPLIGEGAWGPEMFIDKQSAKALDGTYYQGVAPYLTWSEKHTKLNARLLADTKLNLNNWFWHGYDSTKIVLWAMQEANSLDPREVIKAIPMVVEKRKDELMVRPQGTIATKSKGVYLKVPLSLGKFNAAADFTKATSLEPVADKKYLGTPGWMPENWGGYSANPKDGKFNWYPTLSQINAMRAKVGKA